MLLLSAFLSRLLGERTCTLIAILASITAAYLVLGGFRPRLTALLRVGFAYFAVSWCAFGLWHFHIMPEYHPTLGIDPTALPLGVMASFNLIVGLATWLSALWVKREGSYLKGFFHQRLFWTLGAIMIFTSSYFFEHISGIHTQHAP